MWNGLALKSGLGVGVGVGMDAAAGAGVDGGNGERGDCGRFMI